MTPSPLHQHANLTQGKGVFNKFEEKVSPFGVSEVAGNVTDDEARGFFAAADEFASAEPWTRLKCTRYRQFRMVLDPTDEEVERGIGGARGGVVAFRDGDGGGSSNGAGHGAATNPDILDVVELRGLKSDAGRRLNGLRGEVVPTSRRKARADEEKDGDGDERFRVRLFGDGRVVAARASCLGIVRRHDPRRDFVVKVSGADNSCRKVDVYKSWAALHQHLGQSHAFGDSPPCAPDPDGIFCVTLEYLEGDLMPSHFPKELALLRRLGMGPGQGRGRGRGRGRGEIGMVHGLSRDGRRVTRTELRALEAGLRAAVEFVPLLAERPSPPPPYFVPLTFEAREETLQFRRPRDDRGSGRRGRRIGAVRACCSFPDGNLPAPHWPWKSYPQIVERFAPRPSSVKLVEQAVKYHRSQLVDVGMDQVRSDARRGNWHSLAQKYGLAQALWEVEEQSSTLEALSIGKDVLDVVIEIDPKDENKVRHFVLDLLLEVGRWDDAAALLARFPSEDVSEEYIWTAVLIHFKSRGPKSKTTLKALERAVMFNKDVYPLLVGDRILEPGELDRCRAQGYQYLNINGRWVGKPENAPTYVHNFGKYFLQDPNTITWLKGQRDVLKPILEAGDTMEETVAAIADGGIGVKTKGMRGTVSKIDANSVCCAKCGCVGELSRCNGCQEVSYCNRECQLDHWKEHKPACRKNKGTCKKKESEKSAQDDEQDGHPSWKRLNVETRRNLLKFHRENGWKPWQVTAESPAMLNYPSYSFLTAHPEMRFSAHAVATPHSFRMSYADPTDSNVHGKVFQPGQAPFLVLREDPALSGGEEKVPRHNMGTPMEFCLLAEVRYTGLCRMSFQDFYSHKNKGRMFDWPGGDAVETCAGTGEKIEPHNRRVHVLAAFQMFGFCVQGSTLRKLSRVIPRIVTKEGLERLLGNSPPGSPNRLTCYSGPGGRPGCEDMQEIYPDLVRRFAGQNPRKEPKRPPSANEAWEAFHDSGRYCAYETFVDLNACEAGCGTPTRCPR